MALMQALQTDTPMDILIIIVKLLKLFLLQLRVQSEISENERVSDILTGHAYIYFFMIATN